jgi:phosphoribosylformylglycinamidine synthase
LSSAHDLADGGLAQALVESSVRTGFGADISLPEGDDPFVLLFSESSGRVVVSVKPGAADDLAELCGASRIRLAPIGTVGAAGDQARLSVRGQFSLSLAEIRAAWSATLPAVFAAV